MPRAHRWRIETAAEFDRHFFADPEPPSVSDGSTFVVTAPNGMRFESAHPRDAVAAVVADLDERDVFAMGADPDIPPDWPALVLAPLARRCRRCGEHKPDQRYSLKTNGEISGTCDHCCLHDRRRNGKVRVCSLCGEERPDLRMRLGKVGCPECLAKLRVRKGTAEAFDIDRECASVRAAAGLRTSGSAASMARTNIPRSYVHGDGRLF